MKISELIRPIEELAPLSLQESYDNSGLSVGSPGQEVESALITLDVTEEVVEEAIMNGCSLIISHHPVIFGSLKRITSNSPVGKIILKAIKNDVALYGVHTNLDNVTGGVNSMIAEKIGLKNLSILKPMKGMLRKLVTFCPVDHAEKVRKSIFEAGAGVIGNYDSCSYNVDGYGTFRAGEGTDPFVGEIDKIHHEKEIRIETVFPGYLEKNILKALFEAHPYEEVAYDIYPLDNEFPVVGAGMVGELANPEGEAHFLTRMKEVFGVPVVRHTALRGEEITRVAFCGGSGSFLISPAIASGAQVFLTGDIKYHQFFDADHKIIIADVGHFESEQFTKDLIFRILKDKFPNFALRISKTDTNPVNYL